MRKVINQRERQPSPEILQGFKDLLKIFSPSCVVADAQERAGVMHSAIKPITDVRFVGMALTVKLYPGDLVDCLDALKVAGEGDVIVVDACGDTETSIWGGLMAGLCQQKGVMGAVVDGAIVNISSVHAHATVNGVAPYAASKGGITALTRNMAIDYGPAIRVNAIAPGWVLTPLIQSIFDSYDDPAEQQRLVEQRQVMKRIGQPEDIGHAAAFLASDEASFITGTQLFVDGDLTAQLESW